VYRLTIRAQYDYRIGRGVAQQWNGMVYAAWCTTANDQLIQERTTVNNVYMGSRPRLGTYDIMG